MARITLRQNILGCNLFVESTFQIGENTPETSWQLCATRPCREYIRSKNAYLILRELHKAETDPAMKDTIEDVVQLLIKKEEEINADNLISDVEIPEDVAAKLEEERAQLENWKSTRYWQHSFNLPHKI